MLRAILKKVTVVLRTRKSSSARRSTNPEHISVINPLNDDFVAAKLAQCRFAGSRSGSSRTPSFRELDEFSQAIGAPRLYETPPLKMLAGAMLDHAELLNKGAPRNGFQKFAIGGHGIGKTTVGKAVVRALPLFYPGALSLYVGDGSTRSRKAGTRSVPRLSIGRIVYNELMGSNYFDRTSIAADDPFCELEEAILELERTNRRCFLVVDNIDRYYDEEMASTAHKVAVNNIHQLNKIAGDPRGRMAVFVCGSPSCLVGPDDTHPPFINSKKFQRVFLPETRPNDLDAVRLFAGKTASLAELRALLFLTGGNVGAFTEYFLAKGPRNVLSVESGFIQLSRENIIPLAANCIDRVRKKTLNTIDHLASPNYELFKKLMVALYEKNLMLFKSQISSTKNRVFDRPWENFLPLNKNEYLDAANSCMILSDELPYALQELQNKSLIQHESMSDVLWPNKIVDVESYAPM